MASIPVGHKSRECSENQGNLTGICQTKMYGDDECFVFHNHSGKPLHGTLECFRKSTHGLQRMMWNVLRSLNTRAINLQTMISNVGDARDADTHPNIRKRTAAHDARVQCMVTGESSQQIKSVLIKAGILWTRCNGNEHAVVIAKKIDMPGPACRFCNVFQ